MGDFDCLEQLTGKGTSGSSIYRARRRTRLLFATTNATNDDDDDDDVAIKVISRKYLARPTFPKSIILHRELCAMQAIREFPHLHLCPLLDLVHTDHHLGIVQKMGTGGDLFDYVVSRKRVSRPTALHFLRQLAEATHHLHTVCHFVHRDLKLENVVLDQDQRNVMVIDYGFALDLTLVTDDTPIQICGTRNYSSPEVILGALSLQQLPAGDVWSLGVMFFTMLTGTFPFSNATGNGIHQANLLAGKYRLPADLDKDLADLISQLLAVSVEQRITLPALLAHPLLKQPHKEKTFK